MAGVTSHEFAAGDLDYINNLNLVRNDIGSLATDANAKGTMSTQNANAVAITGGTLNGVTITNSSIDFIQDGVGAVARTAQSKLRDKVSIYDFGVVGNGVANDSTAINNALSSGAKEIDGLGLTCKVNTSITIPANVTLRNIKLQAGTAGMDVVLISNNCRMENVKIVGTGTVSLVERGIYPAVDGVTGAYIDVEVSNITVAVQMQPLSSVPPSLNEIHAYVHDIVGTTGTSEGYGVLLSPANDNQVFLRAKNIKRHGLYLSAGASRNQCFVNIDTCYHHAVSIYAVAGQPACVENTVHVKASNLQNAPAQTGFSAAVGITQKAERNRIFVDCVSSGLTDHAVRIEGVGNISGPFPTNNIVYAIAKGTYLGDSVLYSGDADNTVFVDPIIEGKSTASLIKFYDSGANLYTPKRSGAVHGGSLDGIDSTMNGVSNSAARGAVDVSGGILFSRCFSNVADYTGTRIGVNKTYTKTVTFTNVANNSSGNTTITLPESFSNMAAHAQVTSASAPGDSLEAVISAYTPTSIIVYGYNRSGGLQEAISVTVWVTGD